MAVVTTMLEERSERFVENGRRKTSTLVKILNICKTQVKVDVAGMKQAYIALAEALVSKLPLEISTTTLKRATKHFVLESITAALKIQSFDFCHELLRWVAGSKSNAVTSLQLYRHITKTSTKLNCQTGSLVQMLNQVFPGQNFAASTKSNLTWNKSTGIGSGSNECCSVANNTSMCSQTTTVLVSREQLDRNHAASVEHAKHTKAAYQVVLHRVVDGQNQEGLKPVEDLLLNEDQTKSDRMRGALALRTTKQMNRLEGKLDSLLKCFNGGKQERM